MKNIMIKPIAAKPIKPGMSISNIGAVIASIMLPTRLKCCLIQIYKLFGILLKNCQHSIKAVKARFVIFEHNIKRIKFWLVCFILCSKKFISTYWSVAWLRSKFIFLIYNIFQFFSNGFNFLFHLLNLFFFVVAGSDGDSADGAESEIEESFVHVNKYTFFLGTFS